MSTITKFFTGSAIVLAVFSCGKNITTSKPAKTKSAAPAIVDEQTQRERTAFLSIKGEDPFWSAEISQESIKFISVNPSESFEAAYSAPNVSSDGKLRVYKSRSSTHEIEIRVTSEQCKGIVADAGYVTTVKYRKVGETEFKSIDACAKPLIDPRLNFVWRLYEVKGLRVTSEDFGKELPYIDLHIKEYAFTGFAGCNRIKGQLVMEEGAGLIFKDVTATKMTCLAGNKENLVMEALQNGNRYKVENGKLYIFKSNILQAVFTKAT